MENRLKKLFDFQKFEGNSDLQSVIDSVHSRYSGNSVRELSMDEMSWVNAAGQPEMNLVKKDTEKKQP